MKKACITLLIAFLCVSTQGGFAGIVERSSDLSAFAGFMNLERGDSDLIFGARYSYNYSPHSTIEGTVGFLSPGNTKVFVYQLNYRYNFTDGSGNTIPFLTGGIGGVRYILDDTVPLDARALEGTSFAVDFGGGLQHFITDYMAIRFDVRDMIIFFGEDTIGDQVIDVGTTHNVEFTTGISVFFI